MTIAIRLPLTTALALGLAAPLVAQADALQQQLDDLQDFQIIAHRGASGHAPEHTWPAYQQAREMGADDLELDLHMSADG